MFLPSGQAQISRFRPMPACPFRNQVANAATIQFNWVSAKITTRAFSSTPGCWKIMEHSHLHGRTHESLGVAWCWLLCLEHRKIIESSWNQYCWVRSIFLGKVNMYKHIYIYIYNLHIYVYIYIYVNQSMIFITSSIHKSLFSTKHFRHLPAAPDASPAAAIPLAKLVTRA